MAQHHDRKVVRGVLATTWLLLVCSALAGCAFPAPGPARFSPDSGTLAYAWRERWSEPWFEGKILSRTIHVRWCSVRSPELRKSVRLESFGREWAPYDYLPTLLRFSPDSKHLAVIMGNRLHVIDLDSGRSRRLGRADEMVTSVAWSGGLEVVYAAHTKRRGEAKGRSDRAFWRQGVGASAKERVAIYREEGVEAGTEFLSVKLTLEHWSPAGRYVVFRSLQHGGPFKILHAADGKVRTVGRSGSSPQGVAWKPDGSAFICASGKIGTVTDTQALLVYPADGRIVDLSSLYATRGIYRLAWAYGGQRIMVCLADRGRWNLVDPGTRQVVDITALAEARFGNGDRTMWIEPQPLGGCASVLLKGQRWLVDLSGTRWWKLPGRERRLASGKNAGAYAYSPDARWAARLSYDEDLELKHMTPPDGFTTAQPATAAGSRGGPPCPHREACFVRRMSANPPKASPDVKSGLPLRRSAFASAASEGLRPSR